MFSKKMNFSFLRQSMSFLMTASVSMLRMVILSLFLRNGLKAVMLMFFSSILDASSKKKTCLLVYNSDSSPDCCFLKSDLLLFYIRGYKAKEGS